jgi:hypothetical protein
MAAPTPRTSLCEEEPLFCRSPLHTVRGSQAPAPLWMQFRSPSSSMVLSGYAKRLAACERPGSV